MAWIELQEVSLEYKSYRHKFVGQEVLSKTPALQDVNLDVRDKEFVSIVGPSGCGKTTLLRLVAGLLSPDAGQILLDGIPVNGPSEKLAMVFQNIALLPWRTARKNVELALELRHHRAVTGEEASRVGKYLELVGLKGFENYFPHKLSGGMQQRVGLARALAVEPEVLLMDEPFGALDAQTRTLLQDELLKICSQFSTTILFITHDIDEAIYLSDRVTIMTRRPGCVKQILDIDLPTPRYEFDTRSSPRFLEFRRLAWSSIKEEIEGSEAP